MPVRWLHEVAVWSTIKQLMYYCVVCPSELSGVHVFVASAVGYYLIFVFAVSVVIDESELDGSFSGLAKRPVSHA